MISPSFCSVTCWVSFIFLERSFSASSLSGGQQRRSLAGKARALGGKLQAGRQARNVPPAQIDHGPAEMPEHHGLRRR